MSGETTRISIANALKSLAKTKPLDKITVTEIIRLSKVNRSTFYYNFIDKDAVIEYIYKHDFDRLSSKRTSGFWIIDHQAIFKTIREDVSFYQQAVNINSPNNFKQVLFNQIYTGIRQFADEYLKDRPLSEQSKHFICRFYAMSHADCIRQYILSGAKDDPAVLTRHLVWCTEPALTRTLENFIVFESHS